MKTKNIDGYDVTFRRRRYGTTTYTWATIDNNGEAVSLGDPWPCIMPSKENLSRAIKLILQGGTSES